MGSSKASVENVHFHADGLLLSGTLHRPPDGHAPVVVGCHGLYSNRHSPKQIALAEGCCRLGIGYLRFDHRGCGDSQGDFEHDTCLEARCRDLAAAVKFIRRHPDAARRLGLFGSSMGGTVCLNAAAGLDVCTLVTFGAPLSSELGGVKPPREHNAIFPDSPKRHFDITARLGRLANILIIHGQADEVVPAAHAEEIYKRVGEPKKLIIQPGGDHSMSDASHQKSFMRAALKWFQSALLPGGQ